MADQPQPHPEHGFTTDAYALRKNPGAIFKWLERSAFSNEGLAGGLLVDWFLVPYRRNPLLSSSGAVRQRGGTRNRLRGFQISSAQRQVPGRRRQPIPDRRGATSGMTSL